MFLPVGSRCVNIHAFDLFAIKIIYDSEAGKSRFFVFKKAHPRWMGLSLVRACQFASVVYED